MHLATWGVHCLALQLRNRGPWVNNGTLLVRVVQHLRASPGSLDASFDAGRIVLAGHSFGATSVVVALAGGATARGAVLLDPADAIRGLPGYLRKVRTPVAIVGADQRIAVTRNRAAFRTNLAGSVVEGSIVDARHEDAQFPLAVDIASAEPGQLRFVAALTAAARSLGDTGRLDQVWAGFRDAARQGEMLDLRRK
jgi:dienelactone hydrolase